MQGKITKGIAGFYYIAVEGSGIYECKARGVFRKEGKKPLVGDLVEIDILSEDPKEGNIVSILPRRNELIRPAVANIDLSLACMAFSKPAPSLDLLDVFLILMEKADIPCGICFTKEDYASDEEIEKIKSRYREAAYPVFFISSKTGEGIEELKNYLKGKTTALSGPSGVGKSTLTNLLTKDSDVQMETGGLSEKTSRGRNTTRHVELLRCAKDTYLMDTPGFTSLNLDQIEAEDVWQFFPEFLPYEPQCRFQGCMHDKEPDCAIKQAVEDGLLSQERYESYLSIYHRLKERIKKWN